MPGEAWVGGGVYGLLVVFTLQMFRRTKDTDERRDALTEAIAEQERLASEQRNQLAAELEAMRGELNRLRRVLHDERTHRTTPPR